MALIDVDTRMFDPARRPTALTEASDAFGGILTEEEIEALSESLSAMFPAAPVYLAEYHDDIAKYLVAAAVMLTSLSARVTALEG